ncbi:uncharacterized protein LOC131681140 [Topomyia yanbarensis]|uniref:uncharacterized protein LOC131681140 n=1 Tax=Topomyia yanbarensis TaxID=2498891 RepID=UPI00273CC4A3|nr:uncharacterized protein LOC131681140 [Topomyia yanbarensis]
MFIETFTVCGLASLDDRSFRFQPGLNVLHCDGPTTVLVSEVVRWFLYCREASDFRLSMELSSQHGYVEMRIRLVGNREAFREWRGKKRSTDPDRICLQRVFRKPHTVKVDGCFQMQFEQFCSEMEQTGVYFRTESFSPLNVLGRNEISRWVTPARSLWKIVHECLKIEAFRDHANQDQLFKSIQRRKLNSTKIYDFQEKIDELNGKIDGTKMFLKLKANVDMLAGGIAKKELNIYQQVLNTYETKLMKVVRENELMEERLVTLSIKLDEETGVFPQLLDLMIADIERDVLDSVHDKGNAMYNQPMFDLTNNLEDDINKSLGQIQAKLDSILIQSNIIDELNASVTQTESEIELNENCLHLLCMTGDDRMTELGDYKRSVFQLVEKTRAELFQFEIGATSLDHLIKRSRTCLVMPEQSNERVFLLRKGKDLSNELGEVTRVLLKSKLSTLDLYRKLSQNESLILNNGRKIDSLSYETIRGVAEIRHFIETTDISDLKSNFVGFVFEHLMFSEPAVTASVIPYLTHLLTVAVFWKQDLMMNVVKNLRPTICYDVLAIDMVLSDAIPSPEHVKENVFPLTNLLVESPIHPVLVNLLKPYYYTTETSGETSYEVGPDCTVIYLNEDVMFNEGGCLTGGYLPSGDILIVTLMSSLELFRESIDIKQHLEIAKKSILELQDRMSRIQIELVAVGEDSFKRFDNLYHSILDWFSLPTNLLHLKDQRKAWTRKKCQLASWNSLLELVAKDQYEDRSHYQQIVIDRNNSLAPLRRKLHQNETSYNKMLIDLKDDLRVLRELLFHANAIRHFTALPELRQQLTRVWDDFGKDLHEKLNLLRTELAGRDQTVLLNELDQLEQESIEPQRKLMELNDRLREADGFYQELCDQLKGTQVNRKQIKLSRNDDLKRLYQYKRQLYDKDTQPGYKEDEIAKFKFKLQLLYEDERLATSYRTLHLSNMTLPCIEKLIVIKLRLITQMMAGIPEFLRETGTLRLNFQYECLSTAEDKSKSNIFSINNTVGLSVDFVDDDQNVINKSVLAWAHLLFFICFLSVEGCKFLLLRDCLTDLDEDAERKMIALLGILSRNMQIFVTAKSNH